MQDRSAGQHMAVASQQWVARALEGHKDIQPSINQPLDRVPFLIFDPLHFLVVMNLPWILVINLRTIDVSCGDVGYYAV